MMRTREDVPYLKCKKCKDVFIASHLTSHHCYSENSELKSGTDLNRQCCVLDDGIPCNNSILCKTHKLNEKSQIIGRLYPVNLLIQIVKKENQMKKQTFDLIPESVDEEDILKACKIIEEIKPVFSIENDPEKQFYDKFLKLMDSSINKPNDDKKRDTLIKRKYSKKHNLT
ncbi:Nuclear protein Ataxin-7 [Pseudoloma neurophilia]|uniref:Nuclear protein Ataxin-7 n=1 Tax=Pseudoloma neurophilia TaxID=146866 RepID=A0A0R0M006_9MICR|nr:Nuclear protein Ataxin-7 [Pseudoloma neurophilia]